MADIKKFLDQAGVGVLWSRIADELKDKQTAIDAVKTKADANTEKITTLEGKVDTLEKNQYDDTEIRGLISTNSTNIATNTAAIATLNGDVNTVGSVAKTVADAIANIPAATADTLGLVKTSEEVVANSDGVLGIGQVSTDKLVNGSQELVLCGGNANGATILV